MQDGIIKGVGNSRFLKSVPAFLTLYPTYEAFAEALIAGTLPVDLNGINEAGWTQLGTALNKANLLSDATAGLYGLGSDAVPDDVLAAIKPQVDEAATAATSAWVKLLDETLAADTQKWDLILSGIDLSQYQKLILYPHLKGNDTQWVYIRVNGLTTGYSTPNSDPTNAGNVPMMNDPTRQNFGFCEYTWLIELPRIYCVQTGTTTTYSRPSVTGAELPPLADGVTRLDTLNLWYSSVNQRILSGSRVTIYGWTK